MAVDVAIRIGKLDDSGATAQRLTTAPRVILAARSYVEEAGAPSCPADLAHHRIIGGPSAAAGWTFEQDGEVVTINLQPHLTINNNEGVVIAAIHGLGICSTLMRTTRQELLDGSLVELLADWRRPEVDLHAFFPSGRGTRLAARKLVDYLKVEFSKSTPVSS